MLLVRPSETFWLNIVKHFYSSYVFKHTKLHTLDIYYCRVTNLYIRDGAGWPRDNCLIGIKKKSNFVIQFHNI